MKTDPETAQKILSHIDSEWYKFREQYFTLAWTLTKDQIAAAKAGFYAGFKAGVCAMHDADKIL